MKTIYFAFLFFVVLITSCGVSKVDTDSEEKFKKSIEGVKSSLDAEKKIEFEKAIQIITFSETNNEFQAVVDVDGLKRRTMDKLNGKTADEIIAEGMRLEVELQKIQALVEINRKETEKRNEQNEKLGELQNINILINQIADEINELGEKIKELEQKKNKDEDDKLEIQYFFVLLPSFYFQKGSLGEEAVIKLNVVNKTEHAVGKVSFQGTLSSPDRTVPWVQDSFEYEIPGGIEPGEEAEWKIKLNMFSEWNKAPKNRNDMVLKVTVLMIYGADKKPIFKSNFSERDEKNLLKLKEKKDLNHKQIDNLGAEFDRQLKIIKLKWPVIDKKKLEK